MSNTPTLKAIIEALPSLPQRQDSTLEQLEDLIFVANRLGMYDAADAVRSVCGRLDELRYGCFCDIEPHMKPDGCVMDSGNDQDCIYAKKLREKGLRKENCEWWRIIPVESA